MDNEKDEVSIIKDALKSKGFKVKGQTCYLQQEKMCFIVFFQKRKDGIFNTNLGIILDCTHKNYRYRYCDIGWAYWSFDEGIDAKISNILRWFEDRNTFSKIIKQYNNRSLSAFITPLGKQILGI